MDPAAVSAAVPTTLPFDIPEELLGSHLFLEPDSPEALRLQRKAETLYNLSCLLDPYRSMVLFLEQALLWQRIYSFMALLLLAHAMVTFIGRGIAWLGLLPFVCVAAAGYHVLGALLVCFKLDRAWFMSLFPRIDTNVPAGPMPQQDQDSTTTQARPQMPPTADMMPPYSYDELIELFSEVWLGFEDIVSVVEHYRETHQARFTMYVCGILLGAAAVFYIIPTLFIVWIAVFFLLFLPALLRYDVVYLARNHYVPALWKTLQTQAGELRVQLHRLNAQLVDEDLSTSASLAGMQRSLIGGTPFAGPNAPTPGAPAVTPGAPMANGGVNPSMYSSQQLLMQQMWLQQQQQLRLLAAQRRAAQVADRFASVSPGILPAATVTMAGQGAMAPAPHAHLVPNRVLPPDFTATAMSISPEFANPMPSYPTPVPPAVAASISDFIQLPRESPAPEVLMPAGPMTHVYAPADSQATTRQRQTHFADAMMQ